MDAQTVADQYAGAWNERDVARRAASLAEVFSDTGTYLDPLGLVSGRDALVEHITGYQSRFPDATMERRSAVDAHANVLRFAWAIAGADGSTLLEGTDFVVLDDDGRIRSVTGFFGPLA